ncbi:hypothetical protein RIF29_24455 [Crotalaria pallida]|uniref:AT-hook motif nuclear-localized protein n=1 Tax=Crotalaria pallida TaxID=3830 RepID=A0AAN9EKE2_CROPI
MAGNSKNNNNNISKDKNNKTDDKENNDYHKVAVAITRRAKNWPWGSKSKPKPSNIVTDDNPNEFRSHAIEFSSGVDIAESLLRFARTHQRGLCVLSATGTVIDITLRQASGSITLLHGQFDIISLAGMFFPPRSVPPRLTTITIVLAHGLGQMIGGALVGPLWASGPVMVTVATFANAIYERLQSPTKINDKEEQSGDVDNDGNESGSSLPGTSGGGKPLVGGLINAQQVKFEPY